MVDLDAPLDNTRVSLVHWLATDVAHVNGDSLPSTEMLALLNILHPIRATSWRSRAHLPVLPNLATAIRIQYSCPIQ